MGDIADWDADRLYYEEWDDMFEPITYNDMTKTCQNCGDALLVWKKTKNNKWWLWSLEKDEWHNCK